MKIGVNIDFDSTQKGINVATPVDTGDIATKGYVDGKKYSQDIGNGIATAIVVTHNLNTRDVNVQVRDNTSFAYEIVDIEATTVNTVTITFGVAPANNAKRVIIMA